MQAVVVHRPGAVGLVDDLGGQVLREELAHLAPKPLGAGVEFSVETASFRAPEPFGNLEQPRLRITELGPSDLRALDVELHVVLEHEAVAAVEVQARFGRLDRDVAGPPLGHRRQRWPVGIVVIERDGRLVSEELASRHRGVEIGETVLDGLERSDRHTELVALLDVVDGQVERGSCQPGEPRRSQRQLSVVGLRRHGLDERDGGEVRAQLAGHDREVRDCRLAGGGGVEQAHCAQPVPHRRVEPCRLGGAHLLR